MRVLGRVVAVVLVLVAVFLAIVTVGLFLEGNTGAAGLGAFIVGVTALAFVLLFRVSARRGPRLGGGSRPRRSRRDQGLYYGDTSTPGYTGAVWAGDGGADGRHHGGGQDGGYGGGGSFGGGSYGGGGSFTSDSGASSGSDGGSSGGSDGGGGGGGGSD